MPGRSAARAARPTSSSSSPCWKRRKRRSERTGKIPMQNKTEKAAVTTFADHEVITPPHKLKKAVVKPKPGVVPDADPVARAEAALAELAGEFSQWMDQECARLDEARNAIRNGMTAA